MSINYKNDKIDHNAIQKISNLKKKFVDFIGYKNKFELIMRLFVIPGNLDLFLHK